MQSPKYKKECWFPIGDPKEEGFHFCGQVTLHQSVYCPYHRDIAYLKKGEEDENEAK